MTSNTASSSRRRFLRQFAVTSGSSLAAPFLVRSSALGLAGNVAPSERVTYGLIGCGDHGSGWNLDQIFREEDAQVLALCDVDRGHLTNARAKVVSHYQKRYGDSYRACDTYTDFRELLARPDLDAVAVCTPDHWHILPAITAIKSGKDVICEKPLSLFVTEGRALCDAVAATDRVFQTASENRSIDSYIRLCELVRNGRIGELKHIEVRLPGGNDPRGDNYEDRQVQPVPPELDYDMWQGQASVQPYIPARVHGSFRWCSRYSGGRITDWGAHLIDLAQWANGTDRSGPTEVEGKGEFPPPDHIFDTAFAFEVHYRYPSGVTMTVNSKGPGITFTGSEGTIGFNGWRAPLIASNPKVLDAVIGPDEVHLHRPRVVIKREAGGMGGEHRDFIDCVKSRARTYAPAEVGHRTITVAHIGNIAMKLGRTLQWNPDSEQFAGDDEANALLSRHQREPWSLAHVDSWIKAKP